MTETKTLTVLLIEDNPADARLVEELFTEATRDGIFVRSTDGDASRDVQIVHEGTIRAGLDQLESMDADAVLLDLQLPDASGIETVETVVEVAPEIPIVVLTGMPEQRLGVQAVSEGAQDYLVKDDLRPGTLVLTLQYAIERKETERKLRHRSEQLAILNRLTQHDIKNDMSLVIGRAKELTEHVDPRGQDSLEEIIQSGNHVLQLTQTIGDALDSMTEEADAELSAVDLEDVLRTETENATNLYRGAEVRLGEIPHVQVRGNRLLSSVFANLISNGVFYNDKDTPTVRIDATIDGDTVTVRVADNGPGIPRRQREQIFEAGIAGVESTGLGIGLTLVNRLVTQYGGDVRIEENDPEGSVFVVELRRIRPELSHR